MFVVIWLLHNFCDRMVHGHKFLNRNGDFLNNLEYLRRQIFIPPIGETAAATIV
jgi:hypothetical protein